MHCRIRHHLHNPKTAPWWLSLLFSGILLLVGLLFWVPPQSNAFHHNTPPSPIPIPRLRPLRSAIGETPTGKAEAVGPRHSRVTTNGKGAVVLNINARSVDSATLAPLAESIFGKENVFVTATADEAREAAASIVSAGGGQTPYSLVVPVGGDGTLSCMINYLVDARMKKESEGGSRCSVSDAVQDLPLVGYVPMGTGNGVGSSVGCAVPRAGKGLAGTLERFLPGAKKRKARRAARVMELLREAGEQVQMRGEEGLNVVEVPMIEVRPHSRDARKGATKPMLRPQPNAEEKGDLCFFAGAGFDSLMLDDFKSIKAWSSKTGIFPRALGSVFGYVVALIIKTLPKAALWGRHRIHVKVSTRDQETLWVDHRRGDFVLPATTCRARMNSIQGTEDESEESTTIYEGTTGILAAGTSPYYGGGMRLFPFARLTPDKMHLRLGRISPLVGFTNIPKIFEGSYRERTDKFGVIDFLGDDFEVEVESGCGQRRGFPFQHSGESMGELERFRLKVVNSNIRFVNFMEGLVVRHD